jgi:predicted nucleic acid-binding protein
MIVVADAGPLIASARIGRFDLLRRVFDHVIIPQAVYDEVVVKGSGRPGSDETQRALGDWVEVASVKSTAMARSLATKLGQGESEAIALAVELSADMILLDDSKARATANFMGLRVSGTVGVLIQAHRSGLLSDLRQALDNLRANGFRIDDEVYRRVLSLSG